MVNRTALYLQLRTILCYNNTNHYDMRHKGVLDTNHSSLFFGNNNLQKVCENVLK